jgi:ribosome-binding protein aMBF1 (putative translation factor)
MKKKTIDVRKTLSTNIKKHRELLGLSQEKLSEKAKISANMVRDKGYRGLPYMGER